MIYDTITSTLEEKIEENEKNNGNCLGLNEMIKSVKLGIKIAKNFSVKESTGEFENTFGGAIIRKLMYSIYTKSILQELHNESKVFLLDYPIVDTLYYEKHGNLNYTDSIKLPFPSIFFEFSEPFAVVKPSGKEDLLAGMLFSKDEIRSDIERKMIYKNRTGIRSIDSFFLSSISQFKSEENEYTISLFYGKDGVSDAGRIRFNTSNLPSMSFIEGDINYSYDHKSKVLRSTDTKGEMIFLPQGIIGVPNNPKNSVSKKDKEIKNSLRMIDLTLNTINYINAQNIIIKSGKRGKTIGHGDSVYSNKPYHWVEVRKEVVEPKIYEGQTWTLDHRIWVRGHFRHYEDGKCIWIDPYVRGPENAPWKNNRYKLLYDKTIRAYEESKT